jgi:hypothetical protein
MIKKVITLSCILLSSQTLFAGCQDFIDNGKIYPMGYQEQYCASYQETCDPVYTTKCTFELNCANRQGNIVNKVYYYKDFIRCVRIENINGVLNCKD